jgi:orotidine-5'-phosphate decarboxylase
LYEHVARWTVERWNPHGQTGLVVGATYPEEIARVRAIASSAPLLVPGIGAQGGDIAATVAAGFASRAFPALLLNSSRAILYADSGDDWQRAAGIAAEHTARAIAAALPNV